MARKAREVQVLDAAAVPDDAVRGELTALDAGTALVAEHEATTRAVALQLGYALPADSTDPDLIQRDIAANMRRSVEACLEVGRGLRVLKEACGHGNFIARLDVLGLEPSVAQRFMQAAIKFSNAATSQHLTKAIGTQSKLFEMLVLDDEQLDELALTGETGELRLDDIATMSVKELRTALRDARDQGQAKDRLLADKNAKLDELAARQSVIDPPASGRANRRLLPSAPRLALAGAGRQGVLQALSRPWLSASSSSRWPSPSRSRKRMPDRGSPAVVQASRLWPKRSQTRTWP